MIETKKETPQKITLKLSKEEITDKKGRPVKLGPDGRESPTGEVQYKQDDIQGLQSLIGRYDNTKHPGSYKLLKSMISIKNKIDDAWQKDATEISLTIDEAGWLKRYLEGVPDNEAKAQPLRQFEIRTLISVMEQLEE